MHVSQRIVKILLFMMMLFVVCAKPGYAHSTLVDASPPANSSLTESPDHIRLLFNERLEKELFEIKVLDKNGRPTTKQAAEMSLDQKEISLQLPTLSEGIYTVSYKIISADGHPVKGSYVFMMGSAGSVSPDGQAGLEIGGGLSLHLSLLQAAMYGARFLFYVSFLTVIGWMFWRLITPPAPSDVLIRMQKRWDFYLQLLFAAAFLLLMAAQLPELLISPDLQSFRELLTGTRIGHSWLFTLGLIAVGFFVNGRSKVLTWGWVLLLPAAKVLNGHAMSFEPVTQLAQLNYLHLLFASIWTGGIVFVLLHWRKHQETVQHFLPRFSSLALLSIVVLTLSGVCFALGILPKWTYVLYTQWGKLLLVKSVLVIVVCAIGGILRYRMKKKAAQALWTFIKIDAALILLIVLIVGIFTYLNPLPMNSPLVWQEKSEKGDFRMQVSPHSPGVNTITITAHGPVDAPVPKDVRLFIQNVDDSSVAPIEVPLERASSDPSQFSVKGPFLPFAGKWNFELRVMDRNDDETVYDKASLVY
ncbi:copper resistance CopC/CopD family protein [Paenibacillus whitsoniae]|nr:copper resistance protein CopC [Paenibacillus whitsoniae]